MSEFLKKNPEELEENLIKLMNKDWALVTVRDEKSGEFGTMTASWGCFGELWNKPVFICYIRPQRYTYGLAANTDRISLCFFDEQWREALRFCGRKSTRDVDKFKECGFTAKMSESGCAYIDESRLVILGRKLYEDDLKEECFLVPDILKNYEKKDYHRFYICEIEDVLVKES